MTNSLSQLAILASLFLIGCGSERAVVETDSEVKDVSLSETPLFVDVVRAVEDLDNEEQVAAYEWARDKVLEELERSKIAQLPGEDTILTRMGSIDLSDSLKEINSELDSFYEKFYQRERGVSAAEMIPKAFMIYVGVPASISAKVGLSGALSLFLVCKIFKVTRIDKRTEKVYKEFWRTEVVMRGALKAGMGIGAGGGLGVQGGIGFIWGKLDHARDFKGVSASVSEVPLAGGLGPLAIGGGVWSNITKINQPPNLFYAIVGVETGLTAKALETHVQMSGIGDVWSFISRMLDLEEAEKVITEEIQ